MTENIIVHENRGMISGGAIKNANLINVGDVSGSYNAIGIGAQIVVQQVQAVSPAEEQRKVKNLNQSLLARAIEAKVGDYTRRLVPNPSGEDRNPYKYLNSYQLPDAPYFYGRDNAIFKMLDYIHQAPITVLHAASGAGKSSLLQAGIMSWLLAAGHLPLYIQTKMDIGRRTQQLDLDNVIKSVLLPDVTTNPNLAFFQQSSLLGFLTEVSRGLGQSSLYIFLDQFENFFNDTIFHPTLRNPFVKELNACLDDAGLDVRWILSIRKEYYTDLHIFGDHVYHNQVHLPGLNSNEAKSAIIKPALQRNVIYEEGLVGQIISDLSLPEQETQTSVVGEMEPKHLEGLAPTQIQLVCHTLFDELDKDVKKITSALYNQPRGQMAQPGAKGILTGHLRIVLDKNLSIEDGQLADFILVELVNSENRRISCSLSDLMGLLIHRPIEVEETHVQRILNTLVKNGLLATDKGFTYELTHDYLVNEIRLDPETRTRKAAQELLDQEFVNYQAQNWLLNFQKYNFIASQRAYLAVSPDKQEFLLKSEENIEQAAKARKRRAYIVSTVVTALVIFLFPTLFVVASAWMFYARQSSVWQPTNFPLDSVLTISVNPLDDFRSQVCVGSANIGVGCSLDTISWNINQQGLPVDNEAAIFNNPETLLGNLNNNVWSTKIEGIEALGVNLLDPQNLVAAISDDNGLYFSENGGSSWKPIETKCTDPEQVCPTKLNKLLIYDKQFFALRESGRYSSLEPDEKGILLYSTDTGQTWKHIGGQDTAIGIIRDIALKIEPRPNDVAIYVAGDNGLFDCQYNASWSCNTLLHLESSDIGRQVRTSDKFIYFTTYNINEGKGVVYRGQLDSVENISPWVKYNEPPMSATMSTNEKGEDILWLLLENGQVQAIKPDETSVIISKYPGWLLSTARTLEAFTDQNGYEHLLMGHSSGLLEYCPIGHTATQCSK